jgi:hypothetical protein
VRSTANAKSNNNFLTQSELGLHIKKCLEGAQSIIEMCMKNYEQTGDLNALKIALDGNVTLGEMLKQVEEFYDHSYAMILSLPSR